MNYRTESRDFKGGPWKPWVFRLPVRCTTSPSLCLSGSCVDRGSRSPWSTILGQRRSRSNRPILFCRCCSLPRAPDLIRPRPDGTGNPRKQKLERSSYWFHHLCIPIQSSHWCPPWSSTVDCRPRIHRLEAELHAKDRIQPEVERHEPGPPPECTHITVFRTAWSPGRCCRTSATVHPVSLSTSTTPPRIHPVWSGSVDFRASRKCTNSCWTGTRSNPVAVECLERTPAGGVWTCRRRIFEFQPSCCERRRVPNWKRLTQPRSCRPRCRPIRPAEGSVGRPLTSLKQR